ncbi:conserved protein of unknown function [Magnetospirillum gryphiswaldense MSR-1 v2]|uniref:Uncharacterized protein n=1 Tax=Magnetospirillum gryphiswaldense (strain DSM 6361 / JCM 21280 / NBRC 15271 / MSR-1) TaxID=431944 RepID=V6EYT6_MAGGM|nr:hypothetical protein [Magnetospirillum gryphiswaldense]CDK97221.1 conserved protein of unknown function [Magnetospirillum gryphiswaldense MSR-1 v2]
MSKSQAFFDRLIVASQGVSSAERQAEARVRTNDFFNLGSKELKGEGAFAAAKEAEAEIQGLRAAASQDGNAPLIEVYDAALTVFTTVIASKAA